MAASPHPGARRVAVASLAVGGAHTLLLTAAGQLFVVGSNADGQLGLPFQQHLQFAAGALSAVVTNAAEGEEDDDDNADDDGSSDVRDPRGLIQRQYAGQAQHFDATMTQVPCVCLCVCACVSVCASVCLRVRVRSCL